MFWKLFAKKKIDPNRFGFWSCLTLSHLFPFCAGNIPPPYNTSIISAYFLEIFASRKKEIVNKEDMWPLFNLIYQIPDMTIPSCCLIFYSYGESAFYCLANILHADIFIPTIQAGLHLEELYSVINGTGFLGKVWVFMLLPAFYGLKSQHVISPDRIT